MRAKLRAFKHRFFLFGLLSLAWYLVRTGVKPSRAAYPCQRVARTNGQLWLATIWLPLAAFARRKGRTAALASTLLLTVLVVPVLAGPLMLAQADGPTLGLTLTGWTATAQPASDVFVVNGTTGYDDGVSELITLMGAHGLRFYQSTENGSTQGSDGLFARADVILVKVNSQWDQRGGTNTDVLKALLQALVDHPDGFDGEIIVADNGQAQYGSAGNGGSFDWEQNNAEDHSQSIQDVVDLFAPSHDVSTYLWDTITLSNVSEYDVGDMTDGYVMNYTISLLNDAVTFKVSYPKFQTSFGTYVSFKYGVWDSASSSYDADRLKVINLPVFKSHGGKKVTGAVKHYMGVVSDKLTRDAGQQFGVHNTIERGGMGAELAETRMPTLNLVDAIWVNAVPQNGPLTTYQTASRVNVLAASVDPIAIDYWASKYILMQAAKQLGYTDLTTLDPDYFGDWGSFGNWLGRSQQELARAGITTTFNASHMNVYVHDLATIGVTTLHTVSYGDVDYLLSVYSNSLISDFSFDQPAKEIRFNVTGVDGAHGYCNVTIPLDLLAGPFIVFVDDDLVSAYATTNATHSSLYVAYTHSTHNVVIIGTTVISELTSIVTVLVVVVLASAVLYLTQRRVRLRPLA
jgi:hypothetical protein